MEHGKCLNYINIIISFGKETAMNFTFENQGTNTYLVYAITSEDKVDSMSLGMLTNNKINGLAPTIFMQLDMTKYIKYNVSAKVSVKQFFTGPVNKKRLIGVFTGIVDAMLSAEDYMIDTNTILLDLDFIFADVSTCETVLICLPITNHTAKAVDLGTFFKNIVFSTQFDQTENCDYVAKIINYLNSTPVFSLDNFSKLLKEIIQEQAVSQQPVTPQIKTQPVVQQKVREKPASKQVAKPEQPKQVVQQSQNTADQSKQSVNNSGFAVPSNQPARNVAQQNAQSQQAPIEGGKKISMLYLLQHYNKENAAAYKAQKEAAKGAKKTGKNQKESTASKRTFTVPGAPVQSVANSQGFAIPGQQAQSPVVSITQPQQQIQKPENSAQPKKVEPENPTPVSPQQILVQTVPQGQPMNFGETTVLGGASSGETTVLNAGMIIPEVKIQPYLVRAKNNERIELNKPVFRIGKEKSYVDYFISDNTAISRSHANIISRDGEYFVVDTNSTNHTYVNGMMIQSNIETKLADGMKIRLANEDFEFKLR